VATILIISSIVKRLLWRDSPLAGGGQILFRGTRPPDPASWRRHCCSRVWLVACYRELLVVM